MYKLSEKKRKRQTLFVFVERETERERRRNQTEMTEKTTHGAEESGLCSGGVGKAVLYIGK